MSTTNAEKDLCLREAKDRTRKAVELLEMQATGAARAELLNAIAAIEKFHKLAA